MQEIDDGLLLLILIALSKPYASEELTTFFSSLDASHLQTDLVTVKSVTSDKHFVCYDKRITSH